MNKLWIILLFSVSVCLGQTGSKNNSSKSLHSDYAIVSLCEVSSNRSSYNRKQIEIEAFVSHGFENSSVYETGCDGRSSGIWMEYGGTASTSTMYCCGVTPKNTRPKALTVEGMKLPLVENENFTMLNTLLKKDGGRIARATLRGTFFSGKRDPYGNGKTDLWGGFGHFGCCSLFVIQEVVSVLPHNDAGLDYSSTTDQPDVKMEGCNNFRWHEGENWRSMVARQSSSDRGTDIWRYDDPRRVGTEALAKLLGKPLAEIKLEETKKTNSRITYYWRPNGREGARYMVVVNRPYQLSLQARDAAKTIWTVATMYTVCS